MAATLKGRAVVWSIGGITFTAGIVADDATFKNMPQSARFSRGSEKAEVKDDGGIIRAQVFHGFKKTLSMTVIPCALSSAAGSLAGAKASMDAHQPLPGTTVTVADVSGTLIDASYNLIHTTQNRTVDGVATLDLELEQGDEGVDLTTAVA